MALNDRESIETDGDHPASPIPNASIMEKSSSVDHNLQQPVRSDPTPSSTQPRQTYQSVVNNHGVVASVVNIVRNLLREHLLPVDYIRDRVDAYIRPHNFEEAEAKLQAHRVLVLIAAADHGRHDAALTLLNNVGSLTLREVEREVGDTVSFDAIPHERNSGWILDLREDQRVPESYGRTLSSPSVAQKLESYSSYLVVIMPPTLWNQCSTGGSSIAYHLPKPDPIDIVRKQLASSMTHDRSVAWLSDARIKRQLSRESPARAVKWASNIREVELLPEEALSLSKEESGAFSDPVYEAKIRMVLAAAGNWQSELTDWYEKHQSCQERDFLLAAAVLEQKPAGDVFTAVATLSAAINGPVHEASGQQGPGIYQLVKAIEAGLGESSRIQFRQPGYGDAVLDYFWVDRQHLQTKFLDWMCQQALVEASSSADPMIASRVATYVLRWTKRTRSLDFLVQVSTRWAEHETLTEVAAELLTAAALDGTVGKLVRDRLLDWTKPGRQHSPAFLRLVATVCGSGFARVHPKLALLRLSNLTQNDDRSVAEAAQTELTNLWQQPELRKDIVAQARIRLNAHDQGRGSRVAMFTALAALRNDKDLPSLFLYALDGNSQTFELISTGWRELLQTRPLLQDAERTMCRWLDAGTESSSAQEFLSRLLGSATSPLTDEHDDARARITLIAILHRWKDGWPEGRGNFPAGFFEQTMRQLLVHDTFRRPLDAPPPVNMSAIERAR
ncbi:hypothetical protein OG777_05990 [Micromonospora peucetia]|uniref:HEAT repeat-containing protein n=1 Tax=Micromonospora peucetia TaxID=47871 RepID=A0ABZ1EIE0_9ACTN|nr:hypothetical protein [Micromonospora peucetia]MCX4386479.1 hypothetical protein [Micromonospora peucetia]WSA33814.1 hypothetical protein OIE14_07130 [Micromonospora peucetia]